MLAAESLTIAKSQFSILTIVGTIVPLSIVVFFSSTNVKVKTHSWIHDLLHNITAIIKLNDNFADLRLNWNGWTPEISF